MLQDAFGLIITAMQCLSSVPTTPLDDESVLIKRLHAERTVCPDILRVADDT